MTGSALANVIRKVPCEQGLQGGEGAGGGTSGGMGIGGRSCSGKGLEAGATGQNGSRCGWRAEPRVEL